MTCAEVLCPPQGYGARKAWLLVHALAPHVEQNPLPYAAAVSITSLEGLSWQLNSSFVTSVDLSGALGFCVTSCTFSMGIRECCHWEACAELLTTCVGLLGHQRRRRRPELPSSHVL